MAKDLESSLRELKLYRNNSVGLSSLLTSSKGGGGMTSQEVADAYTHIEACNRASAELQNMQEARG
eukprot:5039152-Amphidinium_carterae.1